jgi:AraC-like DNA-binding protein
VTVGLSDSSVDGRPVGEMYELHMRGASLEEVGQRFGLSAAEVSRLFVAQMRAEREQGVSLEEVGQRFGLTSAHVERLLNDSPPASARRQGVEHPVSQMYELYQSGLSLRAVGERFGLSEGRVRQLFLAAGLRRRAAGGVAVVERSVEDMYETYRSGVSLQEVGERFGLSRSRVGELFKAAGLHVRSYSEAGRISFASGGAHDRTVEHPVSQMYELYQTGASLREVGERFGVSSALVVKVFRRAGLERRSYAEAGRLRSADAKRTVEHPVSQMYELYQTGLSLGAVGERFGLSRSRVSELFMAAGLQSRQSAARKARRSVSKDQGRVRKMYALYEQGATLAEVGEAFSITTQRVQQLFGQAGLRTRSLSTYAASRHDAGRQRSDEIINELRRVRDTRLVAQRLGVPHKTVLGVIRENLPVSEYRAITYKHRSNKYSDEEVLGFLREAAGAVGGVLTGLDYDHFARERMTADGRPWPTKQTAMRRFGSWRGALLAAGLSANPSSPVAGMRSFDFERCLDAVRTVAQALGKFPTVDEYDQYARESGGALPSLATVRNRCGTWIRVLREAGM